MEALCQLSYSPVNGVRTLSPHRRLRLLAPVEFRDVFVEPLDFVVAPGLFGEDMDDNVAVVDEYPQLFANAFGTQRRATELFTDAGGHLVGDCGNESLVARARKDEVFGDRQHVANVDDDDIVGLFVVGDASYLDSEVALGDVDHDGTVVVVEAAVVEVPLIT